MVLRSVPIVAAVPPLALIFRAQSARCHRARDDHDLLPDIGERARCDVEYAAKCDRSFLLDGRGTRLAVLQADDPSCSAGFGENRTADVNRGSHGGRMACHRRRSGSGYDRSRHGLGVPFCPGGVGGGALDFVALPTGFEPVLHP